MENFIERVARFADIDTRRAMGITPQKLVALPDLRINFDFVTKKADGAHPDDKYFFMVLDFGNGTKYYKLFSFWDDTYGITYMWMHSVGYRTARYELTLT